MKAAILVDGKYLEHTLGELGIPYPPGIDMEKLPAVLLKDGEEHHRTYIFDALPFVPRFPDPRQVEIAENKKSF